MKPAIPKGWRRLSKGTPILTGDFVFNALHSSEFGPTCRMGQKVGCEYLKDFIYIRKKGKSK